MYDTLKSYMVINTISSSVADLDPGSGVFLTPGSEIRIRDVHISESLETIFWVKNISIL
jgi:hypothetical protein